MVLPAPLPWWTPRVGMRLGKDTVRKHQAKANILKAQELAARARGDQILAAQAAQAAARARRVAQFNKFPPAR